MIPLPILSFILTLSLVPQTTHAIERAFFLDDPDALFPLLSKRHKINISLPEPILFSDLLSAEQAYFLFRRMAATHSTFEFYADPDQPLLLKRKSCLFRARWSFRNKKTFRQETFQVFIYLSLEGDARAGPPENAWKIVEIRAERI